MTDAKEQGSTGAKPNTEQAKLRARPTTSDSKLKTSTGLEAKIIKAHESNNNNKRSLWRRCYDTLARLIWTLLYDPVVLGPMCILMFFGEAMLLELIIIKIPYTEIDYSTYMQQITQIEQGELNYDNIGGDTGPIVYPAGYIFIYSWMKELTKGMQSLTTGQEAFRLLYLMSLALTFLIYLQIEGKHRVKPYVFYLLVLSKRLHSIYVLRLFNDCFTTFFMLGCIFLLQLAGKYKSACNKKDTSKEDAGDYALYANLLTLLAVDCFAFAVSVKMNALLYLPGLLVVLYFLNDENLLKLLGMIVFGVFAFVGINYQFLLNNDVIRESFVRNAFNFSRQFMYKWTVNWKFVPEEIFQSALFQRMLLAMHVILLLSFLFKRWINSSVTGKSVKVLISDGILHFYRNTINSKNVILSDDGSYYIAKTMMMSNVIGVLCARSLHYQFLSWFFHAMPFLLSESTGSFFATATLMAVQEWAWNQYPSDASSSYAAVGVLSVAIAGNW